MAKLEQELENSNLSEEEKEEIRKTFREAQNPASK